MANHTSAKKRQRQDIKKRKVNRETKAAVRTKIKKTLASAKSGEKQVTEKDFVVAQKAISSAATKGVYHKKNASRKISRLAKAVKKANS